MPPKLIGFIGRAGSGKTLCADFLCSQYGYEKVKFASTIKEMLKVIGLTDEHLEGDLKEEPCDLLCGRTPRWAMQSLGTEWGRSLISESLWGNLWEKRVTRLMSMNSNVVTDDIRFVNELKRVKRLNARVIGLTRNAQQDVTHSSEEVSLDWCDDVIDNEGYSPERLTSSLTSLLFSSAN